MHLYVYDKVFLLSFIAIRKIYIGNPLGGLLSVYEGELFISKLRRYWASSDKIFNSDFNNNIFPIVTKIY